MPKRKDPYTYWIYDITNNTWKEMKVKKKEPDEEK